MSVYILTPGPKSTPAHKRKVQGPRSFCMVGGVGTPRREHAGRQTPSQRTPAYKLRQSALQHDNRHLNGLKQFIRMDDAPSGQSGHSAQKSQQHILSSG